jgi:hypothetical protein
MDIIYPLMNSVSSFLLAREFDPKTYLMPIVDEMVTQAFECLDLDIRVMWGWMNNYPRHDLLPALNMIPIDSPDYKWLQETFNSLTMSLWVKMKEHGLLIEDHPMRLEKVMPDYIVVRL